MVSKLQTATAVLYIFAEAHTRYTICRTYCILRETAAKHLGCCISPPRNAVGYAKAIPNKQLLPKIEICNKIIEVCL